MEKVKNSKALGLVITGLVLAVLGVIAFAFAPIYEDLIGGWSFEYKGELWGMYQYGYAPLGLVNNIILGLQSLTKFVVWFDEYNGVINVRAIIIDAVIIAFVLFFIFWIIGIAKNKKSKHLVAAILGAVFFDIAIIVTAALVSALDYVYNLDYTFLLDSVILNTQISMIAFIIVIAATGLCALSAILILIGGLVGMIDAWKKPVASMAEEPSQVSYYEPQLNQQPVVEQPIVQPVPQPVPQQAAPAQPATQQVRPVAQPAPQPRPAQAVRPAQQVRPAGQPAPQPRPAQAVRPAQQVRPAGQPAPQQVRPVQASTARPAAKPAQQPVSSGAQTGRVGSSNINKNKIYK